MRVHEVKTPVLRLAYEESGPKKGERLLLVHGWPDSPRTWDKVLPVLHEAGYRTVVPYLRGYGPSEYRDSFFGKKPRRTGQPVAFAQDMIDLADALGMRSFHFIGHDWGARTAHALSALFPQRLKSMVTISVPFQPASQEAPSFPQARAFWYQWLLCTEPGAKKFREDPVAFGKAQWDAWSPHGWYTAADLAEAARSWTGKDFEGTVLHSYRSRWGHAEKDPRYAVLQTRFEATAHLSTPTLLIHGMEDNCTLAETTDGAGQYFTNGYRRILLEHSGHFPQREQPKETAAAILEHLQEHSA
ncbi:alpha/beta fold hydrolase [Terriglobus aquaticus]|uniref:Alpha/beta fold hydrolase n=1 Tax=Terriglobus aquaticus TaxID=940139 RepID=A0ABW9KJZ3_9BACT|nr:alpha/beta hydrolase [Terriglobus aquaticus]